MQNLISPLSAELCSTRLRGMVGGNRIIGNVRTRDALVAISGESAISGGFGRNSFKPWMKIKLVEANSGTLIICKTTLHPFVILFLSIWFGFLLLAGLALTSSGNWPAVVGVLTLGASAVFLIRIGRVTASNDATFLLEAVSDATEARLLGP